MSNIKEVQFKPPEVDQELVEMIEDWLARAKRGEVRGMAVAAVNDKGKIQTNWYGWRYVGPLFLAAVDVLKTRMIRLNIEDDDD